VIEMPYDTDYREAPLAAIDTAYALTQKGADTPGAFLVPANASRITAIRIGFGSLCQDVYVGTTSAVHLYGGGIEIGEGYFVGPMSAMGSAANTSGHVLQTDPMIYRTNIQVKGGGSISAEAFMHGEDPVSGHVMLLLEYDGIPGRIVDSDYREETAGAAANTYTRLGVRGAGVAEQDFLPSGPIGEVIAGFIVDPDGHATASYTIAPEIQLTGKGLKVSGNYNFAAAWGGIGPDTDISGGDLLINPSRYVTPGIEINAGNRIRASAQNIESTSEGHAGNRIRASAQNIESTSEGHAICGLCYI